MRLDKALVELGKTHTRSQSKDLILRGKVLVNNTVIMKPSFNCSTEDNIEITEEKIYVSRGAHKLLSALKSFQNIIIANKVIADLGASTGGFTEVLLERECQLVYAIDVGENQLHDSLKNNDKVVSMEGVNLKNALTLPEPIDLCVGDLSFISLVKILPTAYKLLKDQGEAILLFKPQFEVGKENLPKDGVVKDKEMILNFLTSFYRYSQQLGFAVKSLTSCGIKGKTGNQEYFFHLQKNAMNLSEEEWEGFCKTL